MKITYEQIRRTLSNGFGYSNDALDNLIRPWLHEEFIVDGVKMTRLELLDAIYIYTEIFQNVVTSSAVEDVQIELSKFHLFVRYLDTEIRKKFKIVPV